MQKLLCVPIVRFDDPGQPGFVELRLEDAEGRIWTFIEKVPIVTTKDLDAESSYPQDGFVACQVEGERVDSSGRRVIRVNTETPWCVEAVEGGFIFEVFAEQLVDD